MYAPIHGYYVGGGKSSSADGSFSIKVRGYDEATGAKFTFSGFSIPDGTMRFCRRCPPSESLRTKSQRDRERLLHPLPITPL